MLADGRESLFIDHSVDDKHEYELLKSCLAPKTSAKAKCENARAHKPSYLRNEDDSRSRLYTTCKLMEHADARTTQIHAKIVDSKKIEAVDMADKMFEQEKALD